MVVPEVEEFEVQGRKYTLRGERRITRGLREVVLTAFDSSGKAVARSAMNTGAARSYLRQKDSDSGASWEELSDIALSNLKVELEE